VPPRPLVFVGRTWTLEGKLELLERRLLSGPFDLIEMILESEDRLEAVVTFMAVLELLRRSAIRVRQRHSFGQILVEPAARPVPAPSGPQEEGVATEQLTSDA
jgi:chromatin segregation and condensation protein Rec8/ScpA/Scc1 (kleisin family)